MTSCTTVLTIGAKLGGYVFIQRNSKLDHDKIMEGCHALELPSVRTQTTLQGRDLRGVT